jgi:hypothetical protein
LAVCRIDQPRFAICSLSQAIKAGEVDFSMLIILTSLVNNFETNMVRYIDIYILLVIMVIDFTTT